MPTTMTPSKEIWVFSQTPVADSFRRFFDPLTYTRSPDDSGGISFTDHKSLWNNVKHNRASRKPSQGDNVIVNVTFVISVNETHRYSSSNSSFSVQTYWQVCVDYGRLGKSTLVDQKLNPTTFEDSNTFANKPDPSLFGIVDITHPLNILRYTIQYYTILYYPILSYTILLEKSPSAWSTCSGEPNCYHSQTAVQRLQIENLATPLIYHEIKYNLKTTFEIILFVLSATV